MLPTERDGNSRPHARHFIEASQPPFLYALLEVVSLISALVLIGALFISVAYTDLDGPVRPHAHRQMGINRAGVAVAPTPEAAPFVPLGYVLVKTVEEVKAVTNVLDDLAYNEGSSIRMFAMQVSNPDQEMELAGTAAEAAYSGWTLCLVDLRRSQGVDISRTEAFAKTLLELVEGCKPSTRR
jgi:hypothetical protein